MKRKKNKIESLFRAKKKKSRAESILSNVTHSFRFEDSFLYVYFTLFLWVYHRSPLFLDSLRGCILKEKVLREYARSSPDGHVWRGWQGRDWDLSPCNEALTLIVWRCKTVSHTITNKSFLCVFPSLQNCRDPRRLNALAISYWSFYVWLLSLINLI